MADEPTPEPGQIGWCDLTVPNAEAIRDFYRKVVGWSSSGLDMGGYEDYCMNLPASGRTVAGVCHARGVNAGLPPVWLVYITVTDLDESLRQCEAAGGRVREAPKGMGGHGRYAVIEDPAGAVAALWEPAR
ncbi:MAG: VOC family protein [Acidobacteria bacterium]|nr:VOC family protein [Acidobacteriota bacterium]